MKDRIVVMCAKCEKPATITAMLTDPITDSVSFGVTCHGETEIVDVSQCEARRAGIDLDVIIPVAFKDQQPAPVPSPASSADMVVYNQIASGYPGATQQVLSDEQVSELAAEMVKGDKSVNWLARAIESATLKALDRQGKVVGETDIYDFAGWLTTRPGVLSVGSSLEAGPMAEAVGEYIKAFPQRFAAQPASAPDVEPSPTAGMSMWERIKHVGGRENAATYIEFGSVQAVKALVAHVLRDLPNPLAKRCYTMSEPHMSGYRLVIGFDRLEDVDAAHAYVAKAERNSQHPAPAVPADFDALVKKHARAQYSSSQRDWDVAEFTPEGLRMLVDALLAARKPPADPTDFN